jgi:hypothetical protein
MKAPLRQPITKREYLAIQIGAFARGDFHGGSYVPRDRVGHVRRGCFWRHSWQRSDVSVVYGDAGRAHI